MAEQKTPKDAATSEAAKSAAGDAPKKRKGLVFMGGGAVTVIALGVVAALGALPSKPREIRLEGPFVTKLSTSDIQVNLSGEGSKRYLVMQLQAEYYTYEEAYVTARIGGGAAGGGEHGGGGAAAEDPRYSAMLKDALLGVAATKSREQVTNPVAVESLLEEIRAAVDPVLFPVCVGNAHSSRDADTVSGLRTGESSMRSTLRGLLHEHVLHIDAPHQTIRLDSGPPVHFEMSNHDLRVADADDKDVYLDISDLKPDFTGDVHVGVAGRVRKIYRDRFLVQ